MANAIPTAAIAVADTTVMAFHRQLVIPPFILLIFSMVSISYALLDHEILLEFKSSLTNHTDLKNWRNDSKPVCNGKHANWIGVFCENDTFWGLKLENMGLSGTIDTNALSKLRTLVCVSTHASPNHNVAPNFKKTMPLWQPAPKMEGSPSPPSYHKTKTGLQLENRASAALLQRSSSGKKAAEAAPKLIFLRDDDGEKFDLPDLMKAPAEILGSGCFGSSYKTALPNETAMVVKRSDEKLLVCDFAENGSLAVHIHGVAKGLAYLYKELPSLVVPHGHLKSSNVLLSESFEPLLTDYALIPIVNPESAQVFMVAYKSSEYIQHGRVTKKTDVWGLGVLILEILTGRFPSNFLLKGKGSNEDDIATWKRLDLKEAVERIERLKPLNASRDDEFFSAMASDITTPSASPDTAERHPTTAAIAATAMAFPRRLVIPPFILLLFSMVSISYALSDSEILLKFKSSLMNNTALKSWRNISKPVCDGKHSSWIGVFCENGTVWGLKLENMGLSGTIDADNLFALSKLRTLSFMHNNFNGPIPEFNNLTKLRSLYLSYNRFSGHIPNNAFQGMVRLTKLYLSKNRFTGWIPASVTTLPKLLELKLDGNWFSGGIPDFKQKGLHVVDLSNNQMEALYQQALLALIVLIIISPQKAATSSKNGGFAFTTIAAEAAPKLTFLRDDDGEKFDLPELLKASAEILGSGCFGSSYKTALPNGTAMVVKRYKQMNSAGKEDFQEHMRRIGRLRHNNVLTLVAYYYRRDEKLLVCDFAENGSLAVHLHARQTLGQPALDWPTRLKIGKGSDEDDIATWVKSKVGDNVKETLLTNMEVFDKEMGAISYGDGKTMMQLLKIGLSCCEGDAQKRLDLKEAVEGIERLKPRNASRDDEYFSAMASDSEEDRKW
ncbi:Detected protein of unknown function [Hibiscus syriacus]|uniref:Protein kinase domain-containing protein n=1 Tax=Hibiscus syriacus TaxID=106335 RepID=A0A6A2WUE2_HIBSY|nr:Detected protein of unknown function [Hibiscus syriacus]